jgi:hypothetical protein
VTEAASVATLIDAEMGAAVDARDQAVGKAIRDLRGDAHMSAATLAEAVRKHVLELREQQRTAGKYDFKASYLLEIERGERPLPKKGILAQALLKAMPDLPIEHQRRIVTCGGLGISEHGDYPSNTLEVGKSPEPRPVEIFTFHQTMSEELKGRGGEALVAQDVLVPWVYARCYQMECNAKAAIDYAALAGKRAMGIEEEQHSEALALVLLDVASAYHVAGKFDKSREFAALARTVAFDVYRRGGSADRRVTKTAARTVLMEQTIAYYRNQGKQVLSLQEQAQQYLRASGDVEGSAKSLNTLALMRFQQGDWGGALKYAEPSAQDVAPQPSTAAAARRHNDPVWSARDFSAFKRRWWYYPTQSLLFDIKASMGQDYVLPERPTLERDFPPFVPRYEWVATRKEDPADVVEGRLRSWEAQARRDGFVVYLPDIHISHGDFLVVVRGDHEKAREQYQAAADAAESNGLLLVKTTAERRINDGGLPPGLAQLA